MLQLDSSGRGNASVAAPTRRGFSASALLERSAPRHATGGRGGLSPTRPLGRRAAAGESLPGKGPLTRALLSLAVLLGVAGLVLGGMTTEALATTSKSHKGAPVGEAVVFGVITDRAGHGLEGFTVTASHREGRRQIVDVRTVSASDGTYRLTLAAIPSSGSEQGSSWRGTRDRSGHPKRWTEIITITGPRGRPTVQVHLKVGGGETHRVDAKVVHRVRMWVFPVFAY